MSYDKDVNVKLETVNNSENICFSIPLDYFWDKLSENDLIKVAKMLVSEGLLSKILKELIEESAMCDGILASTDQNYVKFKETLIKLIDELKESYIEDLQESEMRRWWSIGRSLERIIKIVFPERNISYTVRPHVDEFYIIDKDNNNENVLQINLLDWSCSLNNEKINGKTVDSYFYSIYTNLQTMSKERKEYLDYWVKCREENRDLRRKIKELENRLSKYEKI